jgi:uncharacterized membrane protein
MQTGSEVNFDWGVLSPFCYAISSGWMILSEIEVKQPEATLLTTFIATVPGILLGIGTIIQTVSLIQHRSEKLKQDRYLRELELRTKPVSER